MLSRGTSVVGKAQSVGNGCSLFKGCNAAHSACAAALREPLCERDSALCFLPREQPLPVKHALIRTRTAALNVTELSAWPTSLSNN